MPSLSRIHDFAFKHSYFYFERAECTARQEPIGLTHSQERMDHFDGHDLFEIAAFDHAYDMRTLRHNYILRSLINAMWQAALALWGCVQLKLQTSFSSI